MFLGWHWTKWLVVFIMCELGAWISPRGLAGYIVSFIFGGCGVVMYNEWVKHQAKLKASKK